MITSSVGSAFLFAIVMAAVSGGATIQNQAVFSSSHDAASSLVAALESSDYRLFLWVAGPEMATFWNTGDPERDGWGRDQLVDEVHKHGIRESSDNSRRLLYLGSIEEAFPAPLVKTDAGWRFDSAAGSREFNNRRMRRNKIAVLEICQRFREAEYEYFGRAEGGIRAFAGRIRSTPGQHDGLFWGGGGEDDESPMGPPFAAAAFAERRPDDGTRPLFGYYFKILTGQGPNAANGALDYRTKGRLHKGFALLAWPAEYGLDGTDSFLINYFGDIYQKNLGPDTARTAATMAVFDPDPTWRKFDGID